MRLDRPRLYVDFNEMLAPDLFLLSDQSVKLDSSGRSIALHPGLVVSVYMDDVDVDGTPYALIADGLAERHVGHGWSRAATWCVRLDGRGIREYRPESPAAR
jgi:hypothetical protein